jgi:ribonucleoside-diphosphate reductase alpha chain
MKLTSVLKDRKSHIQRSDFDEKRFKRFVDEIVIDTGKEFDPQEIEELKVKLIQEISTRKEIKAEALFDLIIRESNDKINQFTPQYTYLSASTLRRKLYKEASTQRGFDYKKGYGDYYTFVYMMTEKGIYSDDILRSYTKTEIQDAGRLINKEKDRLFSYSGLFLMDKNYLAKGYNEETMELMQERFLTASLYLLKDEPKANRMYYISEAYWALSNHYIGLATPTLINAGMPMGSLSSCHIMTMDDSLESILDVVKDSGTFSQNGSGIGIFLGNLRSDGSWIRGRKNRSTGITGAAKLLNEIANYVNQLNVRKGAIAVYLPVYHADIFDFLDLRLKTGSQERRAHSLFTAVNIPDEFMRRLNNRGTWTVFDPYELKQKLGIDLNQLYDKRKLTNGQVPNEEDHAFTYNYLIAEKAGLELSKTVKATDIYKKIFESQKTGGTPYMYFSDTVARANPNPHAGMPTGSNLCTEIAQNMHIDEFLSKYLAEDGTVTETKKGKGLVTCNLSSLVIHNVFNPEVEVDLQRVTDIQYRLLDCVIGLNRTPVPQATHTNLLYRAVGAGGLGLATHMADMGIRWESEKASEYVEELYEKIAFAQVTASHKLGIEKGSYPLFEGSDWNTGEYFTKRKYNSPKWLELKESVMTKGIRNGYLSAPAPTGSNSVIMNGSPSLDALYEVIYQDEKAGMKTTIIPSNYSAKTKWFYKSGFEMDEMWSLKIIAAAQKGVDQSISHNLMIHKNTKASEMLRLHNGAWDMNLKTLYYTYVDINEVNRKENCVSCEG